jgi:PAP2 superfamily
MILSKFRRRRIVLSILFLVFLAIHPLKTKAQVAQPLAGNPFAQATPTPAQTKPGGLEKDFLKNILRDQQAIWTSPFHLKSADGKWAIPLLGSTAALLATDRHTSGELVENGDNQQRLRISNDVSKLGAIYTTGGVALTFYLTGRAIHNERARETGLLAAEALLNGGIVAETLKLASQRQRPREDDSSGEFLDGGSSFPSGHAVSAWSLATVIAEEYGQHRPLVQVGVYGLATAVSVARYTGRNHFLSDVLLGSAIGYGIGHYVYHQHHDTGLDVGRKSNSKSTHLKWVPDVSPQYNGRAHIYGAKLAWDF